MKFGGNLDLQEFAPREFYKIDPKSSDRILYFAQMYFWRESNFVTYLIFPDSKTKSFHGLMKIK